MRELPPKNSSMKVKIFLEKGFSFEGIGWGDFSNPRFGEFVFCTAMTGIEESLTDPSFAGQVLVNTVSHVGNTGFNSEDMESSKIWAEGLICRHLEKIPSNWRSKTSLGDWIVGEGRFVVEGIDTREMTTLLREQGSQRGILVDASQGWTAENAQQFIKSEVPDMNGLDLTGRVTCSKAYDIAALSSAENSGYWPLGDELALNFSKLVEQNLRPREIAVWDFGVKRNTLRMLSACGAKVRVLPSTAKADELLAAGKDGILLSNGPGDPGAATHIISELKSVLGHRPIFSICLGHQLVAHAVGGKTFKMKYGHRGIHHPVVQLDESGQGLRTWITSQNHGFAVDPESLPKNVRVSFVHADDLTVEGLSLPSYHCETVQFHPEAGPGPTDSSVLISGFMKTLWSKDIKDFSTLGSNPLTSHHILGSRPEGMR
jgi:carbamoyl-phosphate synthase small subunit